MFSRSVIDVETYLYNCSNDPPEICVDIMERKELLKLKSQKTYNKHTTELPPLNIGQPVLFKKHPQGVWSRGECTQQLSDRSYIVLSRGATYRRNRIHMKPAADEKVEPFCPKSPLKEQKLTSDVHRSPSKSPKQSEVPSDPELPTSNPGTNYKGTTIQESNAALATCESEAVVTTRSGRVVKKTD
ncbi:Uncharacterised protein at_DN1185 [Pycnogonum litorale]